VISTERFKQDATRFRKRAQKLEFALPLVTLLNMYSWAHYGAPYSVVHARGQVDEPQFPPPFLENAAWRFDVEAARILEALEQIPRKPDPRQAWDTHLTAESFRSKAKVFREVAVSHGIKLKMTSLNDLFALMLFDRRYSAVMAALGAGKQVGWSAYPEYLVAACAMYGVEPLLAHDVLVSMYDFGAGE
jgi:hypothetical protein